MDYPSLYTTEKSRSKMNLPKLHKAARKHVHRWANEISFLDEQQYISGQSEKNRITEDRMTEL